MAIKYGVVTTITVLALVVMPVALSAASKEVKTNKVATSVTAEEAAPVVTAPEAPVVVEPFVSAFPQDPNFNKDMDTPKFVLHIQSKTIPECYSYVIGEACREELLTKLAAAGVDTSRITQPEFKKGQIWFMPAKGYDKVDDWTPESMMSILRTAGFRSFVPDQTNIR